jgi:hypothetical protein
VTIGQTDFDRRNLPKSVVRHEGLPSRPAGNRPLISVIIGDNNRIERLLNQFYNIMVDEIACAAHPQESLSTPNLNGVRFLFSGSPVFPAGFYLLPTSSHPGSLDVDANPSEFAISQMFSTRSPDS